MFQGVTALLGSAYAYFNVVNSKPNVEGVLPCSTPHPGVYIKC